MHWIRITNAWLSCPWHSRAIGTERPYIVVGVGNSSGGSCGCCCGWSCPLRTQILLVRAAHDQRGRNHIAARPCSGPWTASSCEPAWAAKQIDTPRPRDSARYWGSRGSGVLVAAVAS
jgi:hypothetical protein